MDLKEINELHQTYGVVRCSINISKPWFEIFQQKPKIDGSTFVASRYNIHLNIIVTLNTCRNEGKYKN